MKNVISLFVIFFSGCQSLDERARLPEAVANPDAWRLVCMLAASNVTVTPDVYIPESARCEETQKRVRLAFDEIVAQGRSAVPVLIENMDRKEFSTYMGFGGNYAVPVSVGYMCKRALSKLFDPIGIMYKTDVNCKGESVVARAYFEDELFGDMQCSPYAWWNANKHMTDSEIREMVRQWYINRETANGWGDEKRAWILKEIDDRFKRDALKRSSLNTERKADVQ